MMMEKNLKNWNAETLRSYFSFLALSASQRFVTGAAISGTNY
jgi:hypothetical protein